RCLDEAAAGEMRARIDAAKAAGDTLGGIVEVRFQGLVAGLGSHVHWDRKLDGRLAGALMSIQSVKGVELGAGFENAVQPGSNVHDPIEYRPGEGQPYARTSNRAGGLEGGMTTGEDLVARLAFKPIATLMSPLPSVDVVTHQAVDAARERSDTTAVPAGSVIALAVAATVLAEAYLERFGGDTLPELQERVRAFEDFARAY
ncbi:MAG TPA: chorismate synthase, partial [Deinococcales bacterium]|nr:chorismate synthase [Deinococcales bacterium]